MSPATTNATSSSEQLGCFARTPPRACGRCLGRRSWTSNNLGGEVERPHLVRGVGEYIKPGSYPQRVQSACQPLRVARPPSAGPHWRARHRSQGESAHDLSAVGATKSSPALQALGQRRWEKQSRRDDARLKTTDKPCRFPDTICHSDFLRAASAAQCSSSTTTRPSSSTTGFDPAARSVSTRLR